MNFLATIVDRAREATGTPSDCTAPSTSHNRGPSTGYRCRGKIAFRRGLVVIIRVILQIEKCLTGAEAEEKRGAAESLAPTDPSSVDE